MYPILTQNMNDITVARYKINRIKQNYTISMQTSSNNNNNNNVDMIIDMVSVDYIISKTLPNTTVQEKSVI